MRRLAVVLFFVLVGVASLWISAQLHLDTPIGREAGRRVLVELVSAEIAGSLDAEEVLSLAPDEAWVANVTIRDPDGRPVIVGERVHVRFDPWALLRGEVRFPLGEVIGGELVLYESESGLPTFVDAFGSSTPRAPDAPFEPGSVLAIVERLDIRDLRVRGTLLGVEGLEVEDVRARLALRIDDRIPEGFELRVDEADGRVVAPFGKELQLVSTSARVRDDASGTRLHARLRTGDGEELGVLLDYARPDGASATDGDDVLDLLLRLDPVRAETVAGSGLAPWAEPLVGEVRGHVRLRGPPDDLELRGWLRTEGGGVAVAGRLASDSDSEVTARTHALQLDRLVDGAPSARVRGRARLALPVEGDPRVDADLDPFRLGELEVPASHLEGSLGEEQLNVDVLRVTTPGGTLEARGRVGFDGSVDLRVEGDVGQLADEPTLAGLVPGARGLARFEATLALDPDGALRADGRWVLTRFRYGPVYVGVLVATGRIDGNVRAPEVALRLGLRDVRVDERPLGDGTGRVEGGPTSYRVELDTQRDARRVGLGGRVVVDDGFRVDLSRVELAEGRLRWTGELTGLTSRGTVLSLERARLRSGNQRVEASGVWRRSRGEDAIELAANELDLGELRALLRGWVEGLPDVDGRVSGTASVGGDLERQPRLHVDATLADGRVGAVAGLDGSVLFQYADGLLVGDLGLTAAGSGELELDLRGTLDRDLRFRDALEYAAFHVDGRGRDLDLGLLQHLPFELPELRGRASGSGHADGGFDAFDFEANVDIPALQFELPESWREEGEPPLSPPLGFRGRVGYADGGLTLRGSFRDDGGQLAEAEASVLLDLLSTLEDPSLLPSLLDVAPWRLALRLPPRRVDRWPLALRRGIPSPESLLASATLTLRGGAYRPAGDLAANVAWVGPRFTPAAALAAEGGAWRTSRTARRTSVSLAWSTTAVWSSGRPTPPRRSTRGCARRRASRFPAPARRSGRSSSRSIDSPTSARTSKVRSPPRSRSSGSSARDLVSSPSLVRQPPRSTGVARRVGDDAHSLALARALDPRSRRARQRTSERGRGDGVVERRPHAGHGRHRASMGEDVWLPEVPEDARLDGSAEPVDTPLEAALLVPQVSEAHGRSLRSRRRAGELRDPLLEGEIELRDGGLAIPARSAPRRRRRAWCCSKWRNLVLQRFEAHDGDGVASLAGDISLEGFAPRRADLALDADGFPVRQEGSVLARLTGQSRLGADFYDGGLQGTVVVDGLSVWLGDDAGRTPQSLAPHPDILVLGRETADEEPAEPYSVSLHVDARRPFTIKGDDFAAELVAVLELGYVDALQLKGEVELRSGHFDIFGKRFDVERGALFFDGETDLDPSVNLVAVHELRSRSGETVTVTASGRLSDPVIRFTSSLTNDRAEIIALLVSGEVRGETAQDVERAPTDFLAGIAAGVLTLSLREEFGQVVPTIVVEGNTYGGTRIRGGWRLEDVLPESLRRVIRGVYIEGFFNTSGQDGEGSRRTVGQVQDYGFLLELALPRNVVNTNTFTPPNNFSLDVTWQP
ncbi:MAG: translocation/assembly module TamB domain-containing protein [Polyangiales bacterium]